MNRLIRLLAVLAGLSVSLIAQAQSWPTMPVKLLVGFSAGGVTDSIARGYATVLSDHLGVPVVVENRVGASGIVAAEAMMRSRDKHTFAFYTLGGHTVRPHVAKLRFDPWKDITLVASIANTPYVFIANPKLGVNTIDDLVRYARRNPGKLNIGLPGIGTTNHVLTGALLDATQIDVVVVPYLGQAPALLAVQSGEIDLAVMGVGAALPQIRSGKVVALAVSDKVRAAVLPDVPSTAELGFKQILGGNANALAGPADVDPAVLNRLRDASKKAINDPRFKAVLEKYFYALQDLTPDELVRFVKEENDYFEPLIRKLNIRLE